MNPKRVFITGATGFVGAHTTLALLRAGISVRLLVRSPDSARDYFREFGFELNDEDLIVGDMNNQALIEQSMQGCDSVFHAAAFVSLDKRLSQEIYQTNYNGIETVIKTACDLGIGNIVYVSSIAAIFQPDAKTLDESSPLSHAKEAYSRSKRDCDEKVRGLQSQGYPIQITYPAGIFGPNDPKLSEGNQALITFFTSLVPITRSGIQFCDVRDLAKAHLHLLSHKPDKTYLNRFVIAGHYYNWRDFAKLLQSESNKRIIQIPIPALIFRAIGKLMDLIKHILPIHSPLSEEAMSIVTQWPTASSEHFLEYSKQKNDQLFRPANETIRDTLNWLCETHHIDDSYIKEKP